MSDLGLLFEISADPSAATTAVEGSASEISAALSRMQDQAGDASSAVTEGAREMGRAHGEAREAIRGTGELIGVTMPRYVANYLSSLGGVQSAMSAAFAGIAVLGSVEVYGRVSDKIGGLEADMHGFSEASIKAWSDTRAAIIGSENELLAYDEKLRQIGQIGLSGSALAAEKQRENAEAMKETSAALAKETEEMEKARQKVNSFGTGLGKLFRSTEQYKRELGDAKDALKQHTDQVYKLEEALLDLQLAQIRVNRETAAGAAKEQEEAARKGVELANKENAEILRVTVDSNREMAKVVADSYRDMEISGENYAKQMKAALADLIKEEKAAAEEQKQLARIQENTVKIQEAEDTQRAEQLKRNSEAVIAVLRKEVEEGKKAHDAAIRQLAQEHDAGLAVTSALQSIGEMYGKNASLKIAAIAAEAAAANYGIAAGAQAAGAGGGGGGGGTRNGGGGGEVSSGGGSAAGSPVLAAGSRPSGAPAPVSVILVGSTADAGGRALLGSAINDFVKQDGGQVMATHDGSGKRLGS